MNRRCRCGRFGSRFCQRCWDRDLRRLWKQLYAARLKWECAWPSLL